MMKSLVTMIPVLLAWIALSASAAEAPKAPKAAEALTLEKMVELLKGIDIRIRSSGDYKALFYLEQKEKDKADQVREGLAYRRDSDQKLMILFTKPKTDA